MALNLPNRYPGRFNPPSAGYPEGSFKNRTAPGALDGSYLEQDWANDKEGFFQSLLDAAGVSADGNVDEVGASQYFSSLQAFINSLIPTDPVLPVGYFSGFPLSNNVTTPNTTVDVGAGSARSSDNTVGITLTATIRGILQSSGAWAAGDNQNKLDAGARANSTWYHVFAIRRTSDGVGDILFSLSPTAPTLPSGYAGFRLIESIYVNSSGNIAGFINSGRSMLWVIPVRDVDTAALGASPTNFTISSPPGRRVKATLSIAHSGAERIVNVFQPSTTPGVPAGPAPGVFTGGYGVFTGDATDTWAMEAQVVTNTASQVAAIANAAGTTFYLVTKGWEVLDR